ncbi:Protein of unknown function [Quadrisphaera granulorum]|uniref:Uncharacterized protein DUF2786 n=1 Tax=Quadrisphaera granulorum TaxID=317664 RepID=A0A316ADL7_9ACTN|nr:DUF2786 domain-containing protein [Quadrisphaera granulorum]PWJ55866.1 uncharacterized protein DUF2786 [Quadrisphaera granulorum]SZE95363.1 Protein of unknown function [Quadrisphaera granulorum]
MGSLYRGPWNGSACACGRPGCDGSGAREEWQELLDQLHEDVDDDAWPEEDVHGDGANDDFDDDDGGWGAGPYGQGPPRTTAELISDAGDALRTGGRTTAAQVLAAGREDEVDLAVRALLLETLERRWDRGWEPADVLRWTRRHLGADRVPLAGLAIGAELARRGRADLPRRFRQQVEAAGVGVGEASLGFLRDAGADQRSLGAAEALWAPVWAVVAAQALQLALELDRQPPLPVIGTAPDESPWTRPDAALEGADLKVLERVRLLLAKAESTTFPAEAEALTAAAQSLVTRHSLESALAASSAAGRPGAGAGSAPSGVRIGVDAPYEGQKAALLAAVARANRCSAVWLRYVGCSMVVGFAADLAAVEVLFTSLLTQAVRGMTAAGADVRPGARTRRPEFRRAYLESFARRIGQRLDEAARTSDSEAADPRLLPVLRERAAAVDAAVADAFPELVTRRGPRTLDRAGWASGWAAAELASLDAGQAVTGRAALPSAEGA